MRNEWFFLLMAAAVLLFAKPAFADNPDIKEGSKLPTIELPAVGVDKALPEQKDAKTLNLKDFQGKKNVV